MRGPSPNRIIDSGSQAVTGIGRIIWKVGSSSRRTSRHAPDQDAERHRDDARQREAAIDAADRGQQMDVQGLLKASS